MSMLDRIEARFLSQLGVSESPAYSNNTPYCDWYGLVGPWCAMFVSWGFYMEGLPLPASTAKGFAYTPSGAAWFRGQGRWSATGPQRGDVVFFNFPNDGVDRISHVAFVRWPNADGSIRTIEGNTNPAGSRTGGMVMEHTRRSGIVGYGRPWYPIEPTPGVKEEEMQVIGGADESGQVNDTYLQTGSILQELSEDEEREWRKHVPSRVVGQFAFDRLVRAARATGNLVNIDGTVAK